MNTLLFGGKWQRRILRTLEEAHMPLTTRVLRIRCGMMQAMDPTGNHMRNALKTLGDQNIIQHVGRGLWTL